MRGGGGAEWRRRMGERGRRRSRRQGDEERDKEREEEEALMGSGAKRKITEWKLKKI